MTRRDVLVGLGLVILLCVMVIVSLTGSLGAECRTTDQMKNSSQMRGIHESMVIFSQDHHGMLPGISMLPGLNSSGTLLDSTDAAFSSLQGHNTGEPGLGGGAMNTRLYILLNGNFIAGDLMINPRDIPKSLFYSPTSAPNKWTNKSQLPDISAGQLSYSLLNIADSRNSGQVSSSRSPGRVGEWHDNVNSLAVLISDRNTAGNTLSPRSVWNLETDNDWKGHVVWGDNHAEFITSASHLTTKYQGCINTDDNLFQDGGSPGDNRDNAFFNYISANY